MDGIGNPASLNGHSYTWEHGRQLTTTRYVETGTDYYHSVGYTYDSINNLTALVENCITEDPILKPGTSLIFSRSWISF